jgi:predicted dehydrogenase
VCQAAAILAVHSQVSASQPRAKDRLRIAAIGVGNRGWDNLLAVRDEAVVAVCDVDARYLERARQRFPDARQFVDFREVFDSTELDAVVVSCPDHTHAHAALSAISHKLHVYCEKPLAHSVAETRRIAQAARAADVVTQLGNHHHSSDGYRQAAAWVRSGLLGEIRNVAAWTTRPHWRQGFAARPDEKPPVPATLNWDLWLGPAPPRPYHPSYHPLTWRAWWDFGGGALGDMGPHMLDPIVAALELKAPTTVAAVSSPVSVEAAPLSSRVTFQFPATKKRGAVKLQWFDGDRKPPVELTGLKRLSPHGALLLGSAGKLFVPAYGGRPVFIPPAGKTRPPAPKWLANPSPGHHAEWILACRGGPPTSSDFQYGANLTQTCLLGNVALRLGETFRWNDVSGAAVGQPKAGPLLHRDYRDGWKLPPT